MQAPLNACASFASKQRFHFSSTKTKILTFNKTAIETNYDSVWKLNKDKINVVKEQEHLGIVRESNTLEQSLVETRIQDGRGEAYSRFGGGFHGLNGLNPITAAKVWKMYIILRLIHGLEVTKYHTSEIDKIEKYQRRTLKQLPAPATRGLQQCHLPS